MFLEAIEQVLQIWAGEPPYNLEGKHWRVTTERTLMPEIGQGYLPKPLQRPHPPIVITAVSPFSNSVTQAAMRGWGAISANFIMPVWVRSHWTKYVEGCRRADRQPTPADWRVAKSIFIADDDRTAAAYVNDAKSPYRFYFNSLLTKLRKGGRIAGFKADPGMPDEAVTLDAICDELIIHGSAQKVADELLAFRDKVGTFGTLLYAGKDWRDRELARRSMVLLAEKVMPAVRAALV
jgi:alkanesulfonate monooxygenase SsuD/methylene tetrahydromethanopterin reductase-like flavin-dependent oxidoreductase (luciferase family)